MQAFLLSSTFFRLYQERLVGDSNKQGPRGVLPLGNDIRKLLEL